MDSSYTLIGDEMVIAVAALRSTHVGFCASGDHSTCEATRLADKMESELGEIW